MNFSPLNECRRLSIRYRRQRSEFLPGRPIQNFVDVDLLRLTHRERDGSREGFGWHRDVRIEGADALRRSRIGDAVGKLRRYRARRDYRRADVVGLDLFRRPSDSARTACFVAA
jgi:hypothetical protein